jgi:PAS domain S-box-containing protein
MAVANPQTHTGGSMRSTESLACFASPAERRGGGGPRVARWFLPAYLLALVVLVLFAPRLNVPRDLLTVLDAIFLVAVPAAVGILALSSFLAGGFLPNLLLGAGVLSQSLACLMTIVMREQSADVPTVALVFDGGLWLAGHFHVANVIACMGGGISIVSRSRRWTAIGIVAVSVGAVLMVSSLLSQDKLPYSFLGPIANPVAARFLLVTSALPFAAAAIGAWGLRNQTSRIFLGWYALVLITVAIGRATELLAVPADVSLHLLARTAYYAAGVFMLFAVLQTAGAYRFLGMPLSRTLTRFLHDTGITYQSLVEISTEAMVAMDPDGTVRYWNPAAERLLWPGVERAHFNFAELAASPDIEEDLRDAITSLLGPAGELSRATHVETILRGAGERIFPVEISLLARRSDLGIAVALVEDIGDRKDTERALRDAAATIHTRARLLQELTLELTEAEQRERRRLAVLLHDHLQQLLVAAKLNLAHHLQKRGDDPPPLVASAIAQLDEAIEAARSLAVEISPPVLEQGGLGAALAWLREAKLRKYGLTVEVEVATEVEPEAAVRDLLFQGARELLFNIVKHAGTAEAWIRVRAEGHNAVAVEVRDGGSGCDPDTILKKQPGQTGFGLFSLAQRLEALGGKLQVECPPGGGTRVVMIAPLRREISGSPRDPRPAARQPVTAATPPVALREKQGALRILVADDHEILRQGVIALLDEQPDFQVVGQAATAPDTLAAAVRLRPDLVVLDVSLERPLSGVQAARDLLAVAPGTVVVGLTMHDDPGIHRAMRAAGAFACITKTDASKTLVATLRSAGASRTPRARSAAGGSANSVEKDAPS